MTGHFAKGYDHVRTFQRPSERGAPADQGPRPLQEGAGPDDAKLSQDFANALLDEGIYVIGFSYPVVPVGKSRIRVQIRAAHTPDQITFTLDKFRKVGQALGAI